MPTFTDTSLRRLVARETPYRVFEQANIAGFGVQVTPAGAKTFFMQHTHDGRRQFFRIGAYPAMPLSVARERARELLAMIEQGVDPRAQPEPPPQGTLEALLSAWLNHLRDAGRRSWRDTEILIRHNIPAELLDRPAATITPADIRQVLAAVHHRGKRVTANRLRAWLSALFQWGLKADLDPRLLARPALFGLTVNPVSVIPRDAAAEQPGQRVLSWSEVRAVWESETLTWPARQAVRLLLLTGQRVNEVVQAPWTEFDLDARLWTLPAARSKNKREHVIPLTPLALELLNELREVWPESQWLFPARGVVDAAQRWGDTALAHAVKRIGVDWNPRDLRRTFKTLAAGAGISRDILDKVQNHSQQDVASRHYDRHDYLAEKRAALVQWDSALQAKLAGDNVVALPVRQRA
jgi:integrase